MRVLLDTHVLLWWASKGGSRLSSGARELIGRETTDAAISVVTAFEIAAKEALGKLVLPEPADRYVPRLIAAHSFGVIGVELAHALRAGSLPQFHRDPFDRLLIAQAQIEGIPIVTADPAIARYDVETIW